ncbi:hypothetical protein MUN82_13775 [Hymenobacter aerilatus]|uniref:Uncharacterized protein n=1 Tax=Hymenobacter aerilatus TaxID=2932251 RepID=A0A8T9SPM5_9BACT|nr:hypothetical protein [Hymenobacter aerilatus]UOR04012.1 hypothetical protein MUN82_13775 [Hymenobacter aerilatus]
MVVPILYCVLFIISDLSAAFDWFVPDTQDIVIDGQPLEIDTTQSSEEAVSWQQYLAITLTVLVRLCPLWVAFLLCVIVLLLLRFTISHSTKKQSFVFEFLLRKHIASQLLIVLTLAYLLGSIIHFIGQPVFQALDFTSVKIPFPPDYWWPYYGWPVQDTIAQGWTIYPPLAIIPMFPSAQAACVKLGTLLAILAFRHTMLRRYITMQQLHTLHQ